MAKNKNGKKEEEAKIEIVEVDAGLLFPDYDGPRTVCRKYVKFPDLTVSISFKAPAPTNMEEWSELTGMPADELAAKLAKTLVHSEAWFDTAKKDLSAEEAQADAFISRVCPEIQEAMQYVEKKASKAKQQAAELEALKAKDRKLKEQLGLDPNCSEEEYQAALAAAIANMQK